MNGASGRARSADRAPAIDTPLLVWVALGAYLVPLAWFAVAVVFKVLGRPVWSMKLAIIPFWWAQALAAAYYAGVWLRSGPRPLAAHAPYLAALGAGTALAAVAGGAQAAVSAGLALIAWLPFAWAWSEALRRLLGIDGALARAGISLYCAAFPLLAIAGALGAVFLGVSLANRGMEGRIEGAVAVAACLAALAPALAWNRRAARRARELEASP